MCFNYTIICFMQYQLYDARNMHTEGQRIYKLLQFALNACHLLKQAECTNLFHCCSYSDTIFNNKQNNALS